MSAVGDRNYWAREYADLFDRTEKLRADGDRAERAEAEVVRLRGERDELCAALNVCVQRGHRAAVRLEARALLARIEGDTLDSPETP